MENGGDGWTYETLKRYFDARIADRDEALRVALVANEKRLDAMNQIREQLHIQANTFLPRGEYMAHHATLEADVDRLQERVDQSTGGSTATQRLTTTLLSVLAILVSAGTVVAVFVVH